MLWKSKLFPLFLVEYLGTACAAVAMFALFVIWPFGWMVVALDFAVILGGLIISGIANNYIERVVINGTGKD